MIDYYTELLDSVANLPVDGIFVSVLCNERYHFRFQQNSLT